MLKKVLIANRGEIACRVMRTCRRLGIGTVAVYSDADRCAQHVAMADEAVRLGPPPADESYLRGDLIIDAALSTGADAIHPGYGFLSENPGFAEAVDQAGLTFIGPPASAIRAMGLKDAAKTLMAQAGVPVVPGYYGDDQDPDVLAREAERLGYPALIKPRAGGGGKGMRRVENAGDFEASLEAARREAMASFGDPHCMVEKWVSRARHIEIQVFGDGHGNVVHLFERDCSLQRRHQKVIEEAPAPGMTAEMRKAMGEAAVNAALAVGYRGAGTVEFIVDVSEGLRPDRFWFLEMNTRLQVEHPVTEMITGLDLVEWQLKVASGEPLPLGQEEIVVDGWAFEARVYAEDAARGFLPATGTLDHVSWPEDLARVDSGVVQGDRITPYYDPLIAKLIVHGVKRQAALAKLHAALRDSVIIWSVTNLAFLSALCTRKDVASGDVDIALIGRHLDELVVQPSPPAFAVAVAAVAVLGLHKRPDACDPWSTLIGWRHWGHDRQFARLDSAGARLDLAVTIRSNDTFEVEGADTSLTIQLLDVAGARLQIGVGGHTHQVTAVVTKGRVSVAADGQVHDFTIPDSSETDEDAGAGDRRLFAPMPGLVKLVSVEAGAIVAKGDTLIVMEAMKMEHTMTARHDGTIEEVLVAEGDQIEAETVLLVMAAGDA
jgi:3-methylcrotonyl-CoA carboxylase alpha subunit